MSELERKEKLEKALRTLIAVEVEDVEGRPTRKSVERSITKFFEGKLKIWYSNGWLTFTESTEGSFEN